MQARPARRPAAAAPRCPIGRGARQAVRIAGAHELVRGAAQLVQVLVSRLEHAAADTARKGVLVDVVHRHLAPRAARLGG